MKINFEIVNNQTHDYLDSRTVFITSNPRCFFLHRQKYVSKLIFVSTDKEIVLFRWNTCFFWEERERKRKKERMYIGGHEKNIISDSILLREALENYVKWKWKVIEIGIK